MKIVRSIVILFVFSFFTLFVKRVNASTVSYIHTDHQGSVVEVTDESGNPVERERYYAYGESRTPNTTHQTPITERAYTGQIRDDSSELYYYNARYYDPSLSTFISVDAVEGGNRFAYVSGNPVMFTDPTGNQSRVPRGRDKKHGRTPKLEPYAYTPTITAPGTISPPSGIIGGQTLSNVPYSEAYDQGAPDPEGFLRTMAIIAAPSIALPALAACASNTFLCSLAIANFLNPSLRAPDTASNVRYVVSTTADMAGDTGEGKITLYKGIQNFQGGDILPGGLTENTNFSASNGHYYAKGTGILEDSPRQILRHLLTGDPSNSPYSSWTPYVERADYYAGSKGIVIASDFNLADPNLIAAPSFNPVTMVPNDPIFRKAFYDLLVEHDSGVTVWRRHILNMMAGNAERILTESSEFLYRGILSSSDYDVLIR